MKLETFDLYRVNLPLVSPFRTSFGTQTVKDALIVRASTDLGEGWGECVAMSEPLYSSEYLDAAEHVIEQHLAPRLFAAADLKPHHVAPTLDQVRGHRMAKASLEMALMDAELRLAGISLASFLGGVREEVDCGVSIGIQENTAKLLDLVQGYLDEGYRRIKLKIEPGSDLVPVRAVREKFPDILLQVDANSAYTHSDAHHLARLDAFDLLLIEQPFPEEDIRSHATLAQIAKTPICLDESIVSAQVAADAIAWGACSIINIKAGRVGGYLEARRIHDVCAANGVPVWCGGMLETGLGRAANVALASLPNFTLPGDTSASDRYFAQDLTEPFALQDGRLRVPTRPGLGVDPIPEVLAEVTVGRKTLSRAARSSKGIEQRGVRENRSWV